MRTIINNADNQEEHCGDRSVIEHLEYGAGHPLRVQRCHAKDDNSHMTDTRIGDEFLEILLRHRAKRSIHDVDETEDRQRNLIVAALHRETSGN